MTTLATTAKPVRPSSAADWLVPLGLLALAFIPIAAGIFRFTTLASHAAITPDNARFFVSPIPVLLHIASVTIYSILGAFQLSRLSSSPTRLAQGSRPHSCGSRSRRRALETLDGDVLHYRSGR